MQPTRDVQWLGLSSVITAGASGEICVYDVSDLGELKITGTSRYGSCALFIQRYSIATVKDVHNDALRELAVNQLEPSRCASGGCVPWCTVD